MTEIRDRRQKHWFWVDDAVIDLYAKAIGPFALALYMVLVRHADKQGQLHPSHGHLQEMLGGVSKTTIKKYLAVLEEHGLLEHTPRFDDAGDKTSHLYTLLPVTLDSAQEGTKGNDRHAGGGPADGLPLVPDDPQNEGVGQQMAVGQEMTQVSQEMTQVSQQMADGQPADGRQVSQQMAIKELVFEGIGIEGQTPEGEGERARTYEAPASALLAPGSDGYPIDPDFWPPPNAFAQGARDAPRVDLELATRKFLHTRFHRPVVDPLERWFKWILEEEERARDLERRHPTRASPLPLLDAQLSQSTSDTVRKAQNIIDRQPSPHRPRPAEEHPYGTDRSRLHRFYDRSAPRGRSVS